VPPENAKRLHVIIDNKDGVLKGTDLANRLVWNEECRMAAMSDVLRVHEWSYIRRIQGHCEQIRPDPEAYGGMSNLDGDTTLSRLTFDAALRGAGAVCEGVDDIMTGKTRNSFAPVRPPGHHAGPRGLTKGEEGGPDSHGFCFLNNISIGAAYSMNKYRETIKRVAIVDFDVHHGNGTEETVRWLKPGLDQEEFFGESSFGCVNVPRYKPWYGEDDAQNVMFVSIHGYGPRERGLESMFPQGAFYPGSGKTKLPSVERLRPKAAGSSSSGSGSSVWDTVGKRETGGYVETINMKSFKKEASSEGDADDNDDAAMQMQGAGSDDNSEEDEDDDYEEGGRDMQGGEEDEDGSDSDATHPNPEHKYTSHKLRAMRKLYTNMDAYSATKKDRDALVLDVGVNLPASADVTSSEYRHMWRNYFRQEIFPSLMEFKPDMIFISAGFDAHKKDTINSGYIALVEEDFDWVTQGLVRVANSCCEGRIVSALEGGYQIGGELCSSFAKSVKTHVAALVTGARTTAPWSAEDAEVERSVEKMHLDEAAERRLQKELARQVQEAARRATFLAAKAEAEAEAAALEDYNEDSHDAVPNGSKQAWGALNAQGTERDQNINSVADDEDPADGSARKRRRARAQVDYVALDLALQAQKDAAAAAAI
jgi:acetoin utilization deacetylase AcuC-like enzyme